MREWIKCSDRMPEIVDDPLDIDGRSAEVLVIVDEPGFEPRQWIAYLNPAWEEFPAHWIMTGRDGYRLDNVTHWRLLPPMPGATDELGNCYQCGEEIYVAPIQDSCMACYLGDD